MTKEQAIEIMNEWNKCEELVIRENTDYDKTIYIQKKEAIETVLNMLKENSAEIEKKNTELTEKNAEIEKKDEIIDLMAEEIYEHRYQNNLNFFKDAKKARGITTSIKDIKQYFKEIAERKSKE